MRRLTVVYLTQTHRQSQAVELVTSAGALSIHNGSRNNRHSQADEAVVYSFLLGLRGWCELPISLDTQPSDLGFASEITSTYLVTSAVCRDIQR